jgi:hypothetical protein
LHAIIGTREQYPNIFDVASLKAKIDTVGGQWGRQIAKIPGRRAGQIGQLTE